MKRSIFRNRGEWLGNRDKILDQTKHLRPTPTHLSSDKVILFHTSHFP
jgi:hypothetical protein